MLAWHPNIGEFADYQNQNQNMADPNNTAEIMPTYTLLVNSRYMAHADCGVIRIDLLFPGQMLYKAGNGKMRMLQRVNCG